MFSELCEKFTYILYTGVVNPLCCGEHQICTVTDQPCWTDWRWWCCQRPDGKPPSAWHLSCLRWEALKLQAAFATLQTARRERGYLRSSAAVLPIFPVVKALIGWWEGCCIPSRTPGSFSAARQTAPPCRDVKMYRCDAARHLADNRQTTSVASVPWQKCL